ncbi:MAG: hypothetical protein B6I22_00545 [Desulfobacteraceae bacterium 4572_123]|nr:MAG: hypothetical protein B6I22_00545 [Desulfobacteraceae bacterium 4572_123]
MSITNRNRYFPAPFCLQPDCVTSFKKCKAVNEECISLYNILCVKLKIILLVVFFSLHAGYFLIVVCENVLK